MALWFDRNSTFIVSLKVNVNKESRTCTISVWFNLDLGPASRRSGIEGTNSLDSISYSLDIFQDKVKHIRLQGVLITDWWDKSLAAQLTGMSWAQLMVVTVVSTRWRYCSDTVCGTEKRSSSIQSGYINFFQHFLKYTLLQITGGLQYDYS